MKIIERCRNLALLACLLALSSGAAPPESTQSAADKGLPAVLPPYLQNPTADGMTVCFLGQGAEQVRVAWALDSQSALTEVAATGLAIPGTPWINWKTRLGELDRGAAYRYQVLYRLPTGSAVSPIYRFRTLDPQAKTLRFAAFNDLHNNGQTLQALMRFVKPDDYEFSLLMGDCFGDPSSANGAHELFRTLTAYLPLLDSGNKPILFVRGNHETRGDFASRLACLFDLPNLDAAQKADDQQWQFTLRAGPVDFLALDTGEDDDPGTPENSYKRPKFWQTYRQREARWLKELLAAQPATAAPWRVFVSHIPLYNPAGWISPSSREYWVPLLRDAHIDLMLAGHDHAWRHVAEGASGNPWPVLIGGGPSLDEGTVILFAASKTNLCARMLAARDGRLLTEFVSPRAKPDKVLEPGTDLIFATPGDGGRSYTRTARADFAKDSFQAEVTVALKGGGGPGCAFFGMGRGQGNPQQYQEPSTPPALFVRLAPSDFAGGVVMASANGGDSNPGSAAVGDGTHRVRLTWDAAGKRALFEIDANWDGHSFQSDSSIAIDGAQLDFGKEARLFVGGANGVKFTQFTTSLLTDPELRLARFGQSFAHDPTARTWLPVAGVATSPANDLLKPLHGQVRLLGCWYSGAALMASRAFDRGALHTDSSQWSCDVRSVPLKEDDGGLDLEVTFKLTEGMAKSAGVAVAFDFADWSTNCYVLIPASVYNGNRNRIEHRAYATGLNRADLYKKDLPLTTTDLPQLSPEPGKPSKVEVTTCNATTPAVCVYNRQTRRAFILLAEQKTRFGDNGLMIEESPDRSRATIVISAPGVRERKPEFIGFGASPDRGVDWKPGDAVTLRLRAYEFETPDIPGLLVLLPGKRRLDFLRLDRRSDGHVPNAGSRRRPAFGPRYPDIRFRHAARPGQSRLFLRRAEPRWEVLRPGRLRRPSRNLPDAQERRRAVLDDQAIPCAQSAGQGGCHQTGLGTIRQAARRCLCLHLEERRPVGELREHRHRRGRRLQHHRRRDGHWRAGVGGGVFSQP
ncbi:MAG: metallophosphoesterase family protein [Verrucomicrobia bacterium]|nr:metallophosphoesterase family protein [Verrucomicrobiota bacterium]